MERLTSLYDTEKENVNEQGLEDFKLKERTKLMEDLVEAGMIEQIIERQNEFGWRIKTKLILNK